MIKQLFIFIIISNFINASDRIAHKALIEKVIALNSKRIIYDGKSLKLYTNPSMSLASLVFFISAGTFLLYKYFDNEMKKMDVDNPNIVALFIVKYLALGLSPTLLIFGLDLIRYKLRPTKYVELNSENIIVNNVSYSINSSNNLNSMHKFVIRADNGNTGYELLGYNYKNEHLFTIWGKYFSLNCEEFLQLITNFFIKNNKTILIERLKIK